jgi:hypothetical protein
MVVRLLVVVLTVVGAIPVRICTCGAAHHHHHTPAPKPLCGHDHAPLPGSSPVVVPDPEPAEHHDADCHAVKPRPLMSVGLQLDFTDVPPADAMAVALPERPEVVPTPGYAIRDFHPPPNRPLFLSLCVLRN